MNKKYRWTAFFLAAVTVLAGCQGGGTAQQGEAMTKATSSGFYFSDFEAADLEGNTVDESIFAEAELTMVNVWGTFCSPCIQEMPGLGELNEEWKDKGVQVIGVCSDIAGQDGNATEEGIAEAKAIVEETGASYVHLTPNPEMVDGYLKFIQAVPATFFVDQNGEQVGEIVLGARDKDDWEAEIEARLESVGKE